MDTTITVLTILQVLNVVLLVAAIWLRLDALRIRRRRLTVLKEIRKIQNKRLDHLKHGRQ